MISVEFNDQLNKHKSVLHEAIGELEYLSSLYGKTGNERIANQLHWIKKSLEDSEMVLSKSYSDALYAAVNEVEANGRNLVRAAIAGATISKK